MKKVVFLIILAIILSICLFVYGLFYGLPWKKSQTAKELENFVEEKYRITVDLEEKFYNFKDGHYGATFAVKGLEDVSFYAEKLHNGTIYDYYPEARWTSEVKEDAVPLIEESFAELMMEDYVISPVYGVGAELGIKETVPSYKEVQTGIELGIHFKDPWTPDNEEKLIKAVASFINTAKENGVKNLGLAVYLNETSEEQGKPKTFSIYMEGNNFNKIQSKEDVEKFISIF